VAAFKLLESFYDKEVALISRWGEEGVDWTKDPAVLSKTTNRVNIHKFQLIIQITQQILKNIQKLKNF
jgi:hypothetical protein